MNQLNLLMFSTEPGKLPALTVNEVLDKTVRYQQSDLIQ